MERKQNGGFSWSGAVKRMLSLILALALILILALVLARALCLIRPRHCSGQCKNLVIGEAHSGKLFNLCQCHVEAPPFRLIPS